MSEEILSLYKYYSIESGLKTLSEGKIKWSSPLIFNDPFDNQCDFIIEGTKDDYVTCMVNNLKAHISEESEFKLAFSDSIVNQQLAILKSLPKNVAFKFIDLAGKSTLYKDDEIFKYKDLFNATIKQCFLRNSSIFCLSENNDNILMWSHYAENHTGIVVNFKDYPPADSPIKLAKKVVYSENLPTFRIEDLAYKNISKEDIYNAFTLTKAKCWEYEQEWRITTFMRKNGSLCEIIPFEKKEVQGIYLGCNISQVNAQKVVSLVKNEYPWAKIYQAYKSKDKFALEFKILTS